MERLIYRFERANEMLQQQLMGISMHEIKDAAQETNWRKAQPCCVRKNLNAISTQITNQPLQLVNARTYFVGQTLYSMS
ncbi:MAG TPA: hypothetical protein VGF67_12180 [Ktedonobacteraceae bacterium]